MANYININLYIAPRTAVYILGGLAKTYKDMPVYVTNYNAIRTELFVAAQDILSQLEQQGIDVTKKRGQFTTYSQLFNYQSQKQANNS